MKRSQADYWKYYHAQRHKLAPRTVNFEHEAYEATLALLMFDYPQKTEVDCIIALMNMKLYAPLHGPWPETLGIARKTKPRA
jgi:hypothetical protein